MGFLVWFKRRLFWLIELLGSGFLVWFSELLERLQLLELLEFRVFCLNWQFRVPSLWLERLLLVGHCMACSARFAVLVHWNGCSGLHEEDEEEGNQEEEVSTGTSGS